MPRALCPLRFYMDERKVFNQFNNIDNANLKSQALCEKVFMG
jgi:hypothetical protein